MLTVGLLEEAVRIADSGAVGGSSRNMKDCYNENQRCHVNWSRQYVNDRRSGVRILPGARLYSLLQSAQSCSGAHPASASVCTRSSFPEGKVAERDTNNSRLSIARVKNEWSCTSGLLTFVHGMYRENEHIHYYILNINQKAGLILWRPEVQQAKESLFVPQLLPYVTVYLNLVHCEQLKEF